MVKQISDKVEVLLNKRVTAEWYSAQLYELMSNWCDAKGFFKAKEKFRQYAQEERVHAQKLTDYIIDRNGCVNVISIEGCMSNYKSLLDIVNKSYEHEITISNSYKLLEKQLCDEGDITSKEFIRWYILEQIEEEAKFADMLAYAENLGITDDTKGFELLKFENYISK